MTGVRLAFELASYLLQTAQPCFGQPALHSTHLPDTRVAKAVRVIAIVYAVTVVVSAVRALACCFCTSTLVGGVNTMLTIVIVAIKMAIAILLRQTSCQHGTSTGAPVYVIILTTV